MERGADPHIGNCYGEPPLLKAVQEKHYAVAHMLLDLGADPNKADKHVSTGQTIETTPLKFASKRGNIDLVKHLLDKGANPNKMENWMEPLHLVQVKIRDYYPGSTALMCAIVGGHKEIVKLLLEKGAKPNVMKTADKSKPYSRMSPLHYAVIYGYKDIATMLLNAGAAINWHDGIGRTPLDCATDRGHQDVAQLLLKRGAKRSKKRNMYNVNDARWERPLEYKFDRFEQDEGTKDVPITYI